MNHAHTELIDLLRKYAAMLRETKSLTPNIPAPRLATNPAKPMATPSISLSPGSTPANPISTRIPSPIRMPSTSQGATK